jgi:FkbM family methyltransferase
VKKVKTRYGTMLVPNTNNDIIGRFLARYGEWAEFEIKFISDNLKDDSSIADIGAFVGTFGIGISHHRKTRSVCFVEANQNVVPLLQTNAKANCRASNVIVDALLCPASYAATQAHRVGQNEGSVSFAAREVSEPATDVQFPKSSISFPDLWKTRGPFDLVKLDVEGMELPILKEMKPLLAKGSISIWAECNEEIDSLDVASFLLECGLKVFYFAFPSYNPRNFTIDPSPLFPFSYEAGLFASQNEPTVDGSLIDAGCIVRRIEDRDNLRLALWRTPRWCPPEIVSERIEETLAIAVNSLRGNRFDEFLSSETRGSGKSWSPVADLRESVKTAQVEFENAQQQVAQLTKELAERTVERDEFLGRIHVAESALENAKQLLAERTKERDEFLKRIQAAESALGKAEAIVVERTLERDESSKRAQLAETALEKTKQITTEQALELDEALKKANAAESALRHAQQVILHQSEEFSERAYEAESALGKAKQIITERSRECDELLERTQAAQATIAQFESDIQSVKSQLQEKQDVLTWSNAIAHDRLVLLRAERVARARLEVEYSKLHQEHRMIVSSAAWRVTRPARSFLAERFVLRKIARTIAKALVKISRRLGKKRN